MTPPRTKRSDLAARAAAIAGETPSAPATEPAEVSESPARGKAKPAVDSPRVKPVRVVVELQPVEHRNLRRLADRYADELGVPQVAMAEVLRVLLNLAQEDERLSTKVSKELARTGGTRRG